MSGIIFLNYYLWTAHINISFINLSMNIIYIYNYNWKFEYKIIVYWNNIDHIVNVWLWVFTSKLCKSEPNIVKVKIENKERTPKILVMNCLWSK